jgi:hypothetical protein
VSIASYWVEILTLASPSLVSMGIQSQRIDFMIVDVVRQAKNWQKLQTAADVLAAAVAY